jgi:hypothetical protein
MINEIGIPSIKYKNLSMYDTTNNLDFGDYLYVMDKFRPNETILTRLKDITLNHSLENLR